MLRGLDDFEKWELDVATPGISHVLFVDILDQSRISADAQFNPMNLGSCQYMSNCPFFNFFKSAMYKFLSVLEAYITWKGMGLILHEG